MERDQNRRPSPGYLPSMLGTLIGANVGGFGLAFAGAALALALLAEPSSDWRLVLGDEGASGGLESVLAGTLGFGVGFTAGGALGCLVGLRLTHQERRGRTALLTAGLLIAALVLTVLVGDRINGWLAAVVFLQLVIIASATLARLVTRPRPTA